MSTASGLEVSRDDLAQALKTAAKLIGKYPGDVGLHFDGGCLSIEAGKTVATAPARGIWPVPIYVSASWVRRMVKRLPSGDPVHLRVEARSLFVKRYSQTCAFAATEHVVSNELSEPDETRLIMEAARILKPLRIGAEDLKKLVSEAHVNGPASWSVEEKRMISIIAKAWVLLAPLGVETSDIRRLVNKVVRDAWKGNKGK